MNELVTLKNDKAVCDSLAAGGVQISVEVDTAQVDEAIEKANQLKATLEECKQLINSLSGNLDKQRLSPIQANHE